MRSRLFYILLAVILAAPAVAGPFFSVVDLGSLGAGSAAFALNSSGMAAGYSLNSRLDPSGVLLGGVSAPVDLWAGQVNGINDAGTAAGTTYSNGLRQAAIASHGTITSLGTLGGVESEAMAVNSSGVAAGRADTGSGQGRAFRWSQGVMQDLGTSPGGTWSAAYAINGAGAVAGTVMTAGGAFRAAMWTPEMLLLELGTLGGNDSYAFAINERGQIAGHSTTAAGWMHAFLFSGGVMRDLGTLGGGSSYAYGVSDAGRVFGYARPPAGPHSHAFLWRDGVMSDLNSLIPGATGWELLEAYAVNGSGQIAGAGLYGGEMRAFRLDPAAVPTTANPEPGTLVLLPLGLLAIRLRRRGRFQA